MTPQAIATLLQPYIAQAPAPPTGWPHVCSQLATYLELLLKWNARTNLTSIREPEAIIARHFGESLFTAHHIGPCPTLLDFGSGAGFPGIPIQLLSADIQVTLAESQARKAAFLREVLRTLHLPTEVWCGRVEAMPPSRQFHTVTLRAVDRMNEAIAESASRASHRIAILTTHRTRIDAAALPQFHLAEPIPLPQSAAAFLLLANRI
ncbi:MAG TPA: 16S rRNA (guanine(527)-N(7))-methyltransferase RsmG [Acidobacteriaceae bacterium]|nr:16S rRNA (guanine(527)-N(7))-methyltransferase RsmG [Acidobacteriaceae bacterium]